MKNKRFIRLILFLILMIAILCAFSVTAFAVAVYPDYAYEDFSQGGQDYTAMMSKTPDNEFVTPVNATQVFHTKGYETNISITETTGDTWEGGANFTIGFGGVFEALGITIGVNEETSYTISTQVSFTIPKEVENGYYRIELRCPKFDVREQLAEVEDIYVLTLFDKLLSDMPALDAGYHILNRYQ